PPLFRLANPAARCEAYLLRIPMLEGRYAQDRQIVPLHRVWEFRRSIRQSLHKCEQIDPYPGPSQTVDQWLRIVKKSIFLAVEAGNLKQPPLDFEVSSANLHQSVHHSKWRPLHGGRVRSLFRRVEEKVEREVGFEPTPQPWKSRALPLSYSRVRPPFCSSSPKLWAELHAAGEQSLFLSLAIHSCCDFGRGGSFVDYLLAGSPTIATRAVPSRLNWSEPISASSQQRHALVGAAFPTAR